MNLTRIIPEGSHRCAARRTSRPPTAPRFVHRDPATGGGYVGTTTTEFAERYGMSADQVKKIEAGDPPKLMLEFTELFHRLGLGTNSTKSATRLAEERIISGEDLKDLETLAAHYRAGDVQAPDALRVQIVRAEVRDDFASEQRKAGPEADSDLKSTDDPFLVRAREEEEGEK
jgi:hypothetical protein